MDTGTTRPFLDYLQAQPRWEDKPRYFPGMGTKPTPPRHTTAELDGWVAKRRDRS